ncbi:MAG: hypothetical protein ACYS1C_00740 [Planctomycetota bacterium]|jgi:hypothetical protein
MNPSQLIAWLICLVLASGAALLAIKNTYEVALLERQFAETQRAANDQTAVLSEIRSILREIERDLSARASPPQPRRAASPPPAAPAPEGAAAGAGTK